MVHGTLSQALGVDNNPCDSAAATHNRRLNTSRSAGARGRGRGERRTSQTSSFTLQNYIELDNGDGQRDVEYEVLTALPQNLISRHDGCYQAPPHFFGPPLFPRRTCSRLAIKMVENEGISSMERKRIRDRRAQQKHRERKDLYTKQLEDQVAFCQRNHEPDHIQLLMEKVGQLEAINDTLLKERRRLLDLANNFQESLTTFFSLDQHHRPVNVRRVTRKSISSSTARPMSGTFQSGINVTPISDTTATPAQTDLIATPRQISSQQPTPTRSNDGDINVVDFADIGDTAIPSSVGTEGFLTNARRQLFSHPPDCPSPTPSIRDYGALGIPSSGEQPEIQPIAEDSPATLIGHLSQTGLSERSKTTTANPVEQAGPEPIPLSTPEGSPETRPSPRDSRGEVTAVSIPIANVSWLLLPVNTVSNGPTRLDCTWLNFPHAVVDSPDVPQPEDLLFGSCKNLLANGIHKSLRTARVAEPERLAMGWLLYIYSRWRIIPTRENFERIPHFLRPTVEQTSQRHPARIDMVPWPGLRLALMKEPSDSQLDETLELLACCLKLRWPWGKEFLQMKDDGSRRLVDEFLKTLMSLDGWGITREFAVVYPDLIQGLNLHIIEYNVS